MAEQVQDKLTGTLHDRYRGTFDVSEAIEYLGIDRSTILDRFGNWLVCDDGIVHLPDGYDIGSASCRPESLDDWLLHLSEKTWWSGREQSNFTQAFLALNQPNVIATFNANHLCLVSDLPNNVATLSLQSKNQADRTTAFVLARDTHETEGTRTEIADGTVIHTRRDFSAVLSDLIQELTDRGLELVRTDVISRENGQLHWSTTDAQGN